MSLLQKRLTNSWLDTMGMKAFLDSLDEDMLNRSKLFTPNQTTELSVKSPTSGNSDIFPSKTPPQQEEGVQINLTPPRFQVAGVQGNFMEEITETVVAE